MKRTIESELLDELPAQDPAALASRRDLQRLNRIMGHVGTMCRLLQSNGQTPRRIVELGAGDGKFMLQLARYFSPAWKNLELILVDFKDVVTDETRSAFAAQGWKTEIVAADVFDFLKKPAGTPADMMIANLFLHQFSVEQLKLMLRLAAERTRVFAACEPRRAGMPLAFSKLVGLVGCNAVTRNDAPLSVRAGFVGREISVLWPASPQWRLRERSVKLFTHTFLAERIAVA